MLRKGTAKTADQVDRKTAIGSVATARRAGLAFTYGIESLSSQEYPERRRDIVAGARSIVADRRCDELITEQQKRVAHVEPQTECTRLGLAFQREPHIDDVLPATRPRVVG